jgi:NADPH-dependent ferric siderophore reductase
MNYKIEKNVPISIHGKSGVWSRLATKMQVGDSILLETRSQAMGLRTALKRFGYKATTRTVEGGIRVWKLNSQGKI